ncbi:MAG: DUF5320 domain-containing protein [Candidatus Marinimicrobia bacterium]|nr:DUF5320 domain-containing protein [Candidatus Neomarinimicrobiota bacterium]
MPRGDRTGPSGFGPMTGRRMGYCVGSNQPGFGQQNFGFGRGRGRGAGFGFGRDYGYPPQFNLPTMSQKSVLENEIKVLKDQLAYLEQQLTDTESEK